MAQKKGVVAMCYASAGSLSLTEHDIGKMTIVAKKGTYVLRCIPIRYTGFHFCYDDRKMEFLINALRVAAGKGFRLRFKIHSGKN